MDKRKCQNQTSGLANHVMDLNVASLFCKSPRSHGLHNGACTTPPETEEVSNPLATLPLDFSSGTANAVDIFGRLMPLDD